MTIKSGSIALDSAIVIQSVCVNVSFLFHQESDSERRAAATHPQSQGAKTVTQLLNKRKQIMTIASAFVFPVLKQSKQRSLYELKQRHEYSNITHH